MRDRRADEMLGRGSSLTRFHKQKPHHLVHIRGRGSLRRDALSFPFFQKFTVPVGEISLAFFLRCPGGKFGEICAVRLRGGRRFGSACRISKRTRRWAADVRRPAQSRDCIPRDGRGGAVCSCVEDALLHGRKQLRDRIVKLAVLVLMACS